jgi:hypothetical protein
MGELTHFYVANGIRASTIIYEIRLDETPQKERLSQALEEAFSLFPNFAVRLLLSPRGLLFAPNHETPLILEEDGKPVRFGEEETHHFLFVLSYQDNFLRFRVHHALSDGRGTLAFIKCVLGHYFGFTGPEIDPLPLEKDAPLFKPYLEGHIHPSAQGRGIFNPTPESSIFAHPESRFSPDNAQGRVFEITCPMNAILKTAKRDDSTPLPFLAVLIANAYRNLYPVGEKTLAIGCAVDYRPIFHDDCRDNAAGSIVLPYFSKIAQFDLPTQRTLLRARLDLETQEENLVASLNSFSSMTQSFRQIPLPIPQAAQFVSSQIAKGVNSTRTTMISYVGGLRWKKELDSHLRSIAVFYSPFAISPYFMGIEDQGIWHLTCTQADNSDRLIKEVYRLLQAETADVAFTDRGIWDFDGLYLDNIPSIS